MVEKVRPRCAAIAASALPSTALAEADLLSKTALPLDSRVLTLLNPAASRHAFSCGIFRFIGLTPRRNAT